MTKKDVIVSIKGSQFTLDEMGFDTVEMVTSGILTQNGQEYVLSYLERDMTGFGDTSTTLTVEKGRVTILRRGAVTTQMIFEQGRKHLAFYDTDEGMFTIGVSASLVRTELSPVGGDIVMEYDVEIDHNVAGESRVNITIRENQAKDALAAPGKKLPLSRPENGISDYILH